MKPRTAFWLSPLAFLVVAAHATTPTSRSGRHSIPRSGPLAATTPASPSCTDLVFANGLDDASANPCPNGSAVTVYTDRAAFLAALAPGFVQNGFDEVGQGASGGLRYTDGGFNYLVYAEFGGDGGLYNGPGYISTDRVDDQIMVSTTLDDAPIGAMGANVWPSDFMLQPTTGTIVVEVTLQDGSIGATETIDTHNPDDFRGFVSTTVPIAYLIIEAPDLVGTPPGVTPDRWPTMDNLVIGPAP
jgi:hypothetical protein